MNAYFHTINNKRCSRKIKCYSPTSKFKLEREISWWQTHKLIISLDEPRNCNSKFIRRLVDVLWLVILTTNFKPLINAYAMKSSLFSRNLAWCLQVKRTLAREISLLIWTIHLVLFNFRFEVNIATLNNTLPNTR